jgi:hypothetical protein
MKKKEFFIFLHEILVKENNQEHIEKLKTMIRGNWRFNFQYCYWITYTNSKCIRSIDSVFMISCYIAVNKTWPFPEDKINEVLNDLKQCKE